LAIGRQEKPQVCRNHHEQTSLLLHTFYLSLFENRLIGYPASNDLVFCDRLVYQLAGKGSKEPMKSAVVPPELRSTAFAMQLSSKVVCCDVALIFGIIADRIDLHTAMLWTIPFRDHLRHFI
jgi:hypothetical protein